MFKPRIEDEEFMNISVRYFMLCNKKSEIKNRIDSKKPLLKSTGGELPELFQDDFLRKEPPQKNEKKEEWSEQKAFSALVEVESSRLKLKEEMGRLIDKTVFFTNPGAAKLTCFLLTGRMMTGRSINLWRSAAVCPPGTPAGGC